MLYKFIEQNSPYYTQAIALRIDLFFKNMNNHIELINDNDENISNHIICLNDEIVIGTARLTFKGNIGVISQMAVSKQNQHKGIGKEILEALIAHCKIKMIDKILLSARKMAIPFYKKFKFETIGDMYPSKKTGIPHQNMQLVLK